MGLSPAFELSLVEEVRRVEGDVNILLGKEALRDFFPGYALPPQLPDEIEVRPKNALISSATAASGSCLIHRPHNNAAMNGSVSE